MKYIYRAIVSSDWNECLAPCGPFDYIAFIFPELLPALDDIFQRYTGNHISLKNAMQQVSALLPKPVTVDQMDAYLDDAFSMYTGVTDLIEWCHSRKILFMLNTTGAVGYFQRAFLIGCMSKPSLQHYCKREGIQPDFIFGRTYRNGKPWALHRRWTTILWIWLG